MADIQQAIYSQLTGHAGLSALIGTRVYPLVLPQNAPSAAVLPAVVYQIIGNDRLERHRGASGDARPTVQLSAWALTEASAAAVAAQMRIAITAMTGVVAGVTVTGAANDSGEIHRYEPDTRRYGISLDFRISHREAVV